MTLIGLSGWLATFFFNISYVPQIYKTWKIKKVDEISIWLWVALVLAYITGLVYTISIHAWPIVVGHGIGFSCVAIYLTLYFKYRRR